MRRKHSGRTNNVEIIDWCLKVWIVLSMVFLGMRWANPAVLQEWLWDLFFMGIFLQNGWLLWRLYNYETEICDLQRKSEHDELTGLKNRMAFAAAAHAIENGGKEATVLVCDIDGLKWINDTLGHQVGDEVIRQAADALIACCPKDTQIFRMGGDEFVALISSKLSQVDKVDLMECIHKHTQAKAHLRLSIGLASFLKGISLKEAIRIADCEMYRLRKEKYQERAEVKDSEQMKPSRKRNQGSNVEIDIV